MLSWVCESCHVGLCRGNWSIEVLRVPVLFWNPWECFNAWPSDSMSYPTLETRFRPYPSGLGNSSVLFGFWMSIIHHQLSFLFLYVYVHIIYIYRDSSSWSTWLKFYSWLKAHWHPQLNLWTWPNCHEEQRVSPWTWPNSCQRSQLLRGVFQWWGGHNIIQHQNSLLSWCCWPVPQIPRKRTSTWRMRSISWWPKGRPSGRRDPVIRWDLPKYRAANG